MEDIEHGDCSPVKQAAQSVRENPKKKGSGKMYEDLRMSKRTINFESQALMAGEDLNGEEVEPLLSEEKSASHIG